MAGSGLSSWLALGLCALATTAPLRAEVEPEKLVVLVRMGESVSPRWQKQALRAAQQTVQAGSRYRWLPPPELSLEESRTALGCGAWDPRCVAAVGKTLGARYVLYIEVVRPFQQRPLLTMFGVRIDAPDDTRSQSVELPDAGENGGRVLEAYVRAMLGGRVPDLVVIDDGRHTAGNIAVAVTAPHARTRVTVDGQPVGEVPLLLPHDLAAGTHTIGLEKPGHASHQLEVLVVAGRPLSLAVDLSPASAAATSVATNAAATRASAGADRGWTAPLGWVSVGIGAAALVASGGLYAGTLATEQQLVAAAAEEQQRGSVASLSQVDYQNAVAKADGLYLGSLVALATGLVLAGVGGGLLLIAPVVAAELAAE
ncbi:MAG: PEGA domain-containing protein [Deltaproteobacteria bacterium]|nr:PEGA domain-containing protein [Deltaproteobacteria bacterium]